MKSYRDFKRELFEERDTFTHEGDLYDLTKLNRLVDGEVVDTIPIKKLTWIFKYDDPNEDHPERIAKSHLSIPILVLKSNPVVILDGLHRVAKAESRGIETLPCKWVTATMLKGCKI